MWKVLIMEPTTEKGFVARHVKEERNTWLPYTSNIQQEGHAQGFDVLKEGRPSRA
jgi:hypothetical protein